MDCYDYMELLEKARANSDYRPLIFDYYPLITPDPKPITEERKKYIEELIEKMNEIVKIPKDKFFEQ